MIFYSSDFAQELVTDRPDQTESAVTVPLHSLQIETGFVYENSSENDFIMHNYSIAGTLFRYGLMNDFELRIGTGYIIQNGEESVNDVDDLLIGFKINLLEENSQEIDLGILAHSNIPISSNIQMKDVEPEVIISAAKTITDYLSTGINLGGKYLDSLKAFEYIYTSAVGLSLLENINAFIEIYGNFSQASSSKHNFDGGITYMLNDVLQLDLSAGKSLGQSTKSWFISTGISIRYD